MGKTGGFLEYARQEPGYRPADQRVKDFLAVEHPFTAGELHVQLARCLECGTPFCHGSGCPLGNLIPEMNELAWEERWEEALALLLAANPFPEFTGRLCPALCEAACVLAIHDEAVTIRHIERAIIETGFARGYLQPAPPRQRLDRKVAVVGSGPAGLAVADALNKVGYPVVVYERAARVGGILRYGIPDFKLEKWILDRRIRLMEQEGVRFETGVAVGADLSEGYLRSRYDAICLCGGAPAPRDLAVPGRELAGIRFAMDYLVAQNKKNSGEAGAVEEDLDAQGKRVVIIGGGDTGADCVGTAVRQGAVSVHQIEIFPEPPAARPAATPWPLWPSIRRDSSSHEEGCVRRWGIGTLGFHGKDGRVTGLDGVGVDPVRRADRGVEFKPRPGTAFALEADLVLLALGFMATGRNQIADELRLARGPQGHISTDDTHQTSVAGVFSAGDMRSGPSLVVRAMADGLAAARGIMSRLEEKKRKAAPGGAAACNEK